MSHNLSCRVFSLIFPLAFFFPLLKTFLASFYVRLACSFVERNIFQDEVLPRYHNLRQPPKDDVEHIRLGLSDNRKQILGRKEHVVVSFTGDDFE